MNLWMQQQTCTLVYVLESSIASYLGIYSKYCHQLVISLLQTILSTDIY